MIVRHMAIKLEHDKGQRANICAVTSSLADYMYIDLFCLIDVATGADLRKLKWERIICLSRALINL